MEIFEELADKVLSGKNKDVKTLCIKALEQGCTPEDILNKGLLEGMTTSSELYRRGDILITHVLMAASAMNTGIKVLQLHYPELNSGTDPVPDNETRGKVVLGTIKGDLHDIGKNLVKMMMESSGIEVIDLGVNVEPALFVDTAIETGAKVIACSSMLTTSMPMLRKVVGAAEKRGVRNQLKIMIGGACATPEFAEKIGADAYTENAARASEKALEFLSEISS